MTIFDASEKVAPLAIQRFHYDSYSGYQYSLERVEWRGKCGLVCVEELENEGTNAKVILPPIYNDIKIYKISTRKSIHDKYEVFADGTMIGQFTLVLNEWIPRCKNYRVPPTDN